MANKIKIGQRYVFHSGKRDSFIAEVIEIVYGSAAKIKIVQDLGFGRPVGHIWPEGYVLSSSYELLVGQEASSI